jgi:hypothetical protein
MQTYENGEIFARRLEEATREDGGGGKQRKCPFNYIVDALFSRLEICDSPEIPQERKMFVAYFDQLKSIS